MNRINRIKDVHTQRLIRFFRSARRKIIILLFWYIISNSDSDRITHLNINKNDDGKGNVFCFFFQILLHRRTRPFTILEKAMIILCDSRSKQEYGKLQKTCISKTVMF